MVQRSARRKINGSSRSPRSVARVMHILDNVSGAPGGQSLAALSAHMRSPKSSVLSLLRGLVGAGYLVHEEGLYRLGAESYRVASAIVAARRFPDFARPTLQRLAEETGETTIIGVLAPEEDAVVYVDKIEPRTALRFAATIGDRRPLYCTSTGRILLAYQSPAAIERYLRHTKLVKLTPLTITDKRGMRTLLARVRAEGLATTIGEATEGVFGIAAPVRDGTGAVIASIVLAGPIARIKSRMPAIAERVRKAGHELSRMMGYVGSDADGPAPRK
jgi:DNA-binding IclR family transcriptional regulator